MDNALIRSDQDNLSRSIPSAGGADAFSAPAAACSPWQQELAPRGRSDLAAPGAEAPALRDVTHELFDDCEALATVWLRCEHGPAGAGAPARVAVPPGAELVLGSAQGADVRLDDAAVSARHCRVAHRGTSIEVTDLDSRNGVRVGGVRVRQAALVPGGCFEIGRTAVVIEAARKVAMAEEGPPLPLLVGRSRPMLQLAAAVRRVASLQLPVLLRGESGTGKDLVARAIHQESARAGRPFVVLNAATIPRELAESELFGHRRGAFTGALRERRGAFLEANHGTLFLDEIASLSLEVQAKLLRVVEEGMVRPLGAEGPIQINVRLIVATCEPLETLVLDRQFRGDLYERLAVCRIQLPALRERPDDIPLLAEHILANSEIGLRPLSPGALAALRAHRWQGNVRELRNVLIQAALRTNGRVLPEHVTAVFAEREPPLRRKITPADALRAFEEVGGNISAAARLAEIPRSTMRDLLRAATRER
ncbi:sigma-54 dependent transcriptional regulator [Sorangium cellulosum]|uniref:Sigma-54 dependent transcriptional regulator n=1 Tax=Sorangium cellulosum TaxID=56 RepID=A0A2L0EV35_SORCE|nr:sigma 54-dependent Fis family transcriptional regulator [Sorangium cellulosum]AUX43135.1 sigma-54 dependent transcriptional regulator [Sorangium cellulosum]